MKKAIKLTHQDFYSSSGHTLQYLEWHKTFKREFTAHLMSLGATTIKIAKANHFDLSGFAQIDNQWFYFYVGDVRFNKNDFYIRKTVSDKDYTGGINFFVSLKSEHEFNWDMKRFIGRLFR